MGQIIHANEGEDAAILTTRQRIEIVHPKRGHEFTIEEIQGFVGGPIEAVILDNGEVIYLHEEGKLLNLPMNKRATFYARLHSMGFRYSGDAICGDVLLCDATETS